MFFTPDANLGSSQISLGGSKVMIIGSLFFSSWRETRCLPVWRGMYTFAKVRSFSTFDGWDSRDDRVVHSLQSKLALWEDATGSMTSELNGYSAFKLVHALGRDRGMSSQKGRCSLSRFSYWWQTLSRHNFRGSSDVYVFTVDTTRSHHIWRIAEIQFWKHERLLFLIYKVRARVGPTVASNWEGGQ